MRGFVQHIFTNSLQCATISRILTLISVTLASAKYQPTLQDHRHGLVPVCSFSLHWVLTAFTHGRMVQAALTWACGSALRWLTHPKTVTHSGTTGPDID